MTCTEIRNSAWDSFFDTVDTLRHRASELTALNNIVEYSDLGPPWVVAKGIVFKMGVVISGYTPLKPLAKNIRLFEEAA
jgi:hypothetical protein